LSHRQSRHGQSSVGCVRFGSQGDALSVHVPPATLRISPPTLSSSERTRRTRSSSKRDRSDWGQSATASARLLSLVATIRAATSRPAEVMPIIVSRPSAGLATRPTSPASSRRRTTLLRLDRPVCTASANSVGRDAPRYASWFTTRKASMSPGSGKSLRASRSSRRVIDDAQVMMACIAARASRPPSPTTGFIAVAVGSSRTGAEAGRGISLFLRRCIALAADQIGSRRTGLAGLPSRLHRNALHGESV